MTRKNIIALQQGQVFLSIVALFLASFMILGAFFSVARAQNNEGGSGITFPVTELGGCTDKTACRAFCDKQENAKVCLDFAKKHNLISAEDAERAEKLTAIGTGPGGCKGRACESYCEDTAHIDECVAFAEKHNIAPPQELKEMKQVAKALKGGAVLPGGCKGKQACEAYCADTTHAEECLTFAEKAGFMKKEEIEHARKVLPLMARGETPGGCKSREQCEAYCESGDHADECLAFAEKAGFMSPKELEMAKKTGGKGPGGCTGRACQTFCNDPANQEVCLNFARDHGLIDAKEMGAIKESMGHMRMGLDRAPEEVRACLRDTLGENVIHDIEAGTLTPGPDVGDRVRTCFEKFAPKVRQQVGGQFNNAPQEVKDCLKSNVGEDAMKKMATGDAPLDPAAGDKVRACFEEFRSHGPNGEEGERGGPDGRGGPGQDGMMRDGTMQGQPPFNDEGRGVPRGMPGMSPEVQACLQKNQNILAQQQGGASDPATARAEMEKVFKECGVGADVGRGMMEQGEGSPSRGGQPQGRPLRAGEPRQGTSSRPIYLNEKPPINWADVGAPRPHDQPGNKFEQRPMPPQGGDDSMMYREGREGMQPPSGFPPQGQQGGGGAFQGRPDGRGQMMGGGESGGHAQGGFGFPPQAIPCLEGAYGADTVRKIMSGETPPPPGINDKITVCMTAANADQHFAPQPGVMMERPPETMAAPIPVN